MANESRGPGSRGGKVAYKTKSGKPVYQSQARRMAVQMNQMMQNWHARATSTDDPEDHAIAAKQALAAAFYDHHAGDAIAAKEAMSYADYHYRKAEAKRHTGRTMKWIQQAFANTAALLNLPRNGKGQVCGRRRQGLDAAGEDRVRYQLAADALARLGQALDAAWNAATEEQAWFHLGWVSVDRQIVAEYLAVVGQCGRPVPEGDTYLRMVAELTRLDELWGQIYGGGLKDQTARFSMPLGMEPPHLDEGGAR